MTDCFKDIVITFDYLYVLGVSVCMHVLKYVLTSWLLNIYNNNDGENDNDKNNSDDDDDGD